MSRDVNVINDLKTAAVLAGSAGLLGAATVPVLLPSIFELVPPDQRTLPLPMPLFCVVLAVQVFGGLHAPAAAFIFGGLHNVPPLFWVWMVSLNALVGVACAVWYLRVGVGGAILVHFGADLVWHVLSQLSCR